jgi:hypothetical protein
MSVAHAAPFGKEKTVHPVGPSRYSATPIRSAGKSKVRRGGSYATCGSSFVESFDTVEGFSVIGFSPLGASALAAPAIPAAAALVALSFRSVRSRERIGLTVLQTGPPLTAVL